MISVLYLKRLCETTTQTIYQYISTFLLKDCDRSLWGCFTVYVMTVWMDHFRRLHFCIKIYCIFDIKTYFNMVKNVMGSTVLWIVFHLFFCYFIVVNLVSTCLWHWIIFITQEHTTIWWREKFQGFNISLKKLKIWGAAWRHVREELRKSSIWYGWYGFLLKTCFCSLVIGNVWMCIKEQLL